MVEELSLKLRDLSAQTSALEEQLKLLRTSQEGIAKEIFIAQRRTTTNGEEAAVVTCDDAAGSTAPSLASSNPARIKEEPPPLEQQQQQQQQQSTSTTDTTMNNTIQSLLQSNQTLMSQLVASNTTTNDAITQLLKSQQNQQQQQSNLIAQAITSGMGQLLAAQQQQQQQQQVKKPPQQETTDGGGSIPSSVKRSSTTSNSGRRGSLLAKVFGGGNTSGSSRRFSRQRTGGGTLKMTKSASSSTVVTKTSSSSPPSSPPPSLTRTSTTASTNKSPQPQQQRGRQRTKDTSPPPPPAAASTTAKTPKPPYHNSNNRVQPRKSLSIVATEYENEKTLQDNVERELVKVVCMWSHRVVVYGAGAGALMLWINQQPIYINPAMVSLFGMIMSIIFRKPSQVEMRTASALIFITCAIIKHAISQGCSASLVPAIYGFIPCAFGFLFRNTKAVKLATLGVLAATAVIFSVDVMGYCTSEPIQAHEKGYILADRLVPLLMLILGNGVVLVVIVNQSQESTKLHAQAAKTAARLADTRRDVLHRVTHELRTPLNGLVGSVELLATSDTLTSPEDVENVLCMQRCLSSIVQICDNVLMVAKSRGLNRNNAPTATTTTTNSTNKNENANGSSSDQQQQQSNSNNSRLPRRHRSRSPSRRNLMNGSSNGSSGGGGRAHSPNASSRSLMSGTGSRAASPIRRMSTQKITSIFQIANIVDDVVGMFAAAAYNKGIALQINFVGCTRRWVRGQEGELRQVLLNLVGNALKFTNEGSITIRIHEQQQQQPSSKSGSSSNNNNNHNNSSSMNNSSSSRHRAAAYDNNQNSNWIQYYVAVQDTGIGIDPTTSDQLFEAFQQGEQNAVSRQHPGTGLGLTICREFVALMGSTIHVDGQKGKGATFYFTLKLKEEDEPPTFDLDNSDKDEDDEDNNNNNNEPYLGPCHVVIADPEDDSSATCRSIVQSMAPNATIRVVSSSAPLISSWAKLFYNNSGSGGDDDSTNDAGQLQLPKFAFLTYFGGGGNENDDDDDDSSMLSESNLLQLKNRGWHVIAYCDQASFPQLVAKQQSGHILAVFRKPVPLVRMAKTFRTAIIGHLKHHAAAAAAAAVTSSNNNNSPPPALFANLNEQSTTTTTVAATTTTTPPRATPATTNLFNMKLDDNTNNNLNATKAESAQPLFQSAEPMNNLEATPPAATNGNGVAAAAAAAATPISATNGNHNQQNGGGPSPAPIPMMTAMTTMTKKKKKPAVELQPGSKIVVVDDTPVNVKVLVKMLTRSTSVPVESCFDGQSAIDLMKSSESGDKLLFLMDWHMPEICGLTASDSIRQIAKERYEQEGASGPKAFVCMVTADIEGLHTEMEKLDIGYDGTVTNGRLDHERSGEYTVVDLLADKPVTFKSIQAILEWFREQVEQTG